LFIVLGPLKFLGPGAASLFLLVITAPGPSALLYNQNTNLHRVCGKFFGQFLGFDLGSLTFGFFAFGLWTLSSSPGFWF
jgi:hypothetical protein